RSSMPANIALAPLPALCYIPSPSEIPTERKEDSHAAQRVGHSARRSRVTFDHFRASPLAVPLATRPGFGLPRRTIHDRFGNTDRWQDGEPDQGQPGQALAGA